jgi:ketosteroid isomerase-like protein
MPQNHEEQILDAEDRLATAMLRSDVDALNDLLSPDLIFTNHLGQLLGKEDDLAAHRSGLLTVEKLQPSEQHLHLHENVAIVSVKMQISGAYDGHPADGDFRFTRVCALSVQGTWQVVAAHATLIA